MAEMRDLKADLEELESLKENDVHFMSIVCFIENNAEKWLEQGVVELERAIKAERLKDVLVKYNKFLVAEVLNKWERSEQLEALVRELVDMLERVTPRYLAGRLELDLDLVHEANGLLKKAKEVLGDGN